MTSQTAQIQPFWEASFPINEADLLQQLPFVPGLREIVMLRQVHALEHATVWVLSETPATTGRRQQDNETLGGLSTDRGFYLYGTVNQTHLQQAAKQALKRLQQGEWDLAIHPRCGTNVSATIFLMAGLTLGTSLLFPKGLFGQLLGLGVATAAAVQLAPDVGSFAQKYITTSIPFNLAIEGIFPTADFWGRSATFVQVKWRDG